MSRHRRRRAPIAFMLTCLSVLSAGIVATACGDDDTGAGPDSGVDGGRDTSNATPDTGRPDTAATPGAAVIARGKYLVDHLSDCKFCHTPMGDGGLDMSKYLSGRECFIDVNGAADGGCLHTANLTNDPTGLKNRTDEQIKTMFLDGKRPDGKNLHPVMPYWSFHNMKPEDANAIVAYLRTVPGVAHQVPASDPPFADVPAAATAIDPTTIPAASPDGGAAAERGRYLATMAGPCLECHTAPLAPGGPRPIDMSKPFAGGRSFGPVQAVNLTPHATGLQGWTPADIVRVLKQGRDRADAGVCPPMPAGPMGAFGGLTDQDALDIATYIVGLPPIENATTNCTR